MMSLAATCKNSTLEILLSAITHVVNIYYFEWCQQYKMDNFHVGSKWSGKLYGVISSLLPVAASA